MAFFNLITELHNLSVANDAYIYTE